MHLQAEADRLEDELHRQRSGDMIGALSVECEQKKWCGGEMMVRESKIEWEIFFYEDIDKEHL